MEKIKEKWDDCLEFMENVMGSIPMTEIAGFVSYDDETICKKCWFEYETEPEEKAVILKDEALQKTIICHECKKRLC